MLVEFSWLHRSLADIFRLLCLLTAFTSLLFTMVFVQIVWSVVLSTLWRSSAMKTLADQDAANADAVAKCYSGPEQSVWELVMGKQIDIGGASSTLELAKKAGVGPGMKGVELNSNNGGGMRCLVRLAGVDSMIGVELTKSVAETGKKRTEEEGLSDKISFINKNSLDNGLPDARSYELYARCS